MFVLIHLNSYVWWYTDVQEADPFEPRNKAMAVGALVINDDVLCARLGFAFLPVLMVKCMMVIMIIIIIIIRSSRRRDSSTSSSGNTFFK